MDGETGYLSKSQFAAQQGWSPSYVTKLKDQSRLVLAPDGKRVDVAATLLRLQRTESPEKEAVRQHHAAGRTEKHVGAHTKPTAPNEEVGSQAADPKYWEVKTRREAGLAVLTEIEVKLKTDEVVYTAGVINSAFTTNRMLRDAVLGLPTRLSPELAGMTDAFEIEIKLRDALRKVFEDASNMSADDLRLALRRAH